MMGAASNVKQTRVLVWVKTDVVEVIATTRRWRIIEHDESDYEVRAFDNGRFQPAWDGECYFDSLDEALAEIEAFEAELCYDNA